MITVKIWEELEEALKETYITGGMVTIDGAIDVAGRTIINEV